MRQVSNGVPVPAFHTDFFATPTTNATGVISCTLSYVPVALSIQVQFEYLATRLNRFVRLGSLAGKTLEVVVYKLRYYKTDSPTGTATVTDAAGATPHTHALGFSPTDLLDALIDTEAQPNLYVNYAVLGT